MESTFDARLSTRTAAAAFSTSETFFSAFGTQDTSDARSRRVLAHSPVRHSILNLRVFDSRRFFAGHDVVQVVVPPPVKALTAFAPGDPLCPTCRLVGSAPKEGALSHSYISRLIFDSNIQCPTRNPTSTQTSTTVHPRYVTSVVTRTYVIIPPTQTFASVLYVSGLVSCLRHVLALS